MTIGGSLFLIAVGAILRFAVTWRPGGIDLKVVGLILIIIGVVGLLLGLFMMFGRRRRPAPVYDRPPDQVVEHRQGDAYPDRPGETRRYDQRRGPGY